MASILWRKTWAERATILINSNPFTMEAPSQKPSNTPLTSGRSSSCLSPTYTTVAHAFIPSSADGCFKTPETSPCNRKPSAHISVPSRMICQLSWRKHDRTSSPCASRPKTKLSNAKSSECLVSSICVWRSRPNDQKQWFPVAATQADCLLLPEVAFLFSLAPGNGCKAFLPLVTLYMPLLHYPDQSVE